MTYCTYPGCIKEVYELGLCLRHLCRVGVDPRAAECVRQAKLLQDKAFMAEYRAATSKDARKSKQYEHQSRRCRVCGMVCVSWSHLRTHWAAQHQETT